MSSKSLTELQHDVVSKWNSPPEIMVIDDDEWLAHVFNESLLRLGIDQFIARDGYAAEEMYQGKMRSNFAEAGSSQHPFDLVFLDLKLPGMGGVEVLAKIRTMWPKQPIVIISGNIDLDRNSQIFEHGVVAFMTKPISFSDIRDCILMHNIRMKNNGVVSAPPFHS